MPRSPNSACSVTTSVRAWSGWAASDSMLTTGTWSTAVAAGGVSYNQLTPTDASEIDMPSGNAYFNGIPVVVSAR